MYLLFQSTSNDNDGAATKPPQPLRERCMYGANCYRYVDIEVCGSKNYLPIQIFILLNHHLSG